MLKYIFIHGACQGGWCWYKLGALLDSRKIDYAAPDLPGHGADKTPLHEITLEKYVAAIRYIINQTDQKTVLIGHSMGGFIASQVAELEHERVNSIIYLAALLPGNNETVSGLLKRDTGSRLLQSIRVSEDNAFLEVQPDKQIDIYFNTCSAADTQYGITKLYRQATKPLYTPINLTEKFESIPKHYVQTINDNALSRGFQAELCGRYNNISFSQLNAGHAVYFSHCNKLLEIILRAKVN